MKAIGVHQALQFVAGSDNCDILEQTSNDTDQFTLVAAHALSECIESEKRIQNKARQSMKDISFCVELGHANQRRK